MGANHWRSGRERCAVMGSSGAAGPISVDPILLIGGRRFREGLVFRHVDRFAGHAQVR